MGGRAAALAAAALMLAGCDGPGPQAAPQPVANIAARAAAADFPALSGRVVDAAGLLSQEDEASLSSALAGLQRRTGDQLVIVTLASLHGREIDDYGLALGNHWGVGQAGRGNGVLIIVAPAERLTRIEVGTGLEAILTDERARRIVERDLLPAFREGRWHAGLAAGSNAIIATLIEHEHAPRRGRP